MNRIVNTTLVTLCIVSLVAIILGLIPVYIGNQSKYMFHIIKKDRLNFYLYKFIKNAGYKKIKINYYQRYSLDNNIKWLLKEHKINISMPSYGDYLNLLYKNKLIKTGRADTLKAVVSV